MFASEPTDTSVLKKRQTESHDTYQITLEQQDRISKILNA